MDLLADTEPTPMVKCVVMVPSHELAQQIDRRMEGVSYYIPGSSLPIHAGSVGKELAASSSPKSQGADMVIEISRHIAARRNVPAIFLHYATACYLAKAWR